eukprot:c26920_g2_i2 orf=69-296(+)
MVRTYKEKYLAYISKLKLMLVFVRYQCSTLSLFVRLFLLAYVCKAPIMRRSQVLKQHEFPILILTSDGSHWWLDG